MFTDIDINLYSGLDRKIKIDVIFKVKEMRGILITFLFGLVVLNN